MMQLPNIMVLVHGGGNKETINMNNRESTGAHKYFHNNALKFNKPEPFY